MDSCYSQDANIYCPGNTSKPNGWSDDVFHDCINPSKNNGGWNDPAVKWNQNQPRH
jgi:hypothetical protein